MMWPRCAVATNLAQMRALVASLESALAFTRALAGALPVLAQLLASATLSDVQDAIGAHIGLAKFGVAGAATGLRRMLPLVFSREQGESLFALSPTCLVPRSEQATDRRKACMP
jgi:hypothetical protein